VAARGSGADSEGSHGAAGAHHAVLEDILPEHVDVAADLGDREGGGAELGPGRPPRRRWSGEAEQPGEAAHAPRGACMGGPIAGAGEKPLEQCLSCYRVQLRPPVAHQSPTQRELP